MVTSTIAIDILCKKVDNIAIISLQNTSGCGDRILGSTSLLHNARCNAGRNHAEFSIVDHLSVVKCCEWNETGNSLGCSNPTFSDQRYV